MTPKVKDTPEATGMIIIKLGRNFQVTVPRHVVRLLGLKNGDMFEVKVKDGCLILRKVTVK